MKWQGAKKRGKFKLSNYEVAIINFFIGNFTLALQNSVQIIRFWLKYLTKKFLEENFYL